MKYLSSQEILDLKDKYEHLSSNQTARENHNTDYCSGDSNSLHITRKDNGDLFCFCHRCGKSGYYSETYSRVRNHKEKTRRTGEELNGVIHNIKLPNGLHQQPDGWPPQARAWYGKCGITEDEIVKYGIQYDSVKRRVIIPIYNNSDLVSYQSRKIFEDDPRPKYYTISSDRTRSYWISQKFDIKSMIVVEDVLSAIVISRSYNVIALTGINLFDNLMLELSKYPVVYIWLDNDNPKVKMKQIELKNRLSLWGDTRIIKTDKDPKYYTKEEIQCLLK